MNGATCRSIPVKMFQFGTEAALKTHVSKGEVRGWEKNMLSFQIHLLGLHEIICGFLKQKPNINLTLKSGQSLTWHNPAIQCAPQKHDILINPSKLQAYQTVRKQKRLHKSQQLYNFIWKCFIGLGMLIGEIMLKSLYKGV